MFEDNQLPPGAISEETAEEREAARLEGLGPAQAATSQSNGKAPGTPLS